VHRLLARRDRERRRHERRRGVRIREAGPAQKLGQSQGIECIGRNERIGQPEARIAGKRAVLAQYRDQTCAVGQHCVDAIRARFRRAARNDDDRQREQRHGEARFPDPARGIVPGHQESSPEMPPNLGRRRRGKQALDPRCIARAQDAHQIAGQGLIELGGARRAARSQARRGKLDLRIECRVRALREPAGSVISTAIAADCRMSSLTRQNMRISQSQRRALLREDPD
jgi:hypothetical protein